MFKFLSKGGGDDKEAAKKPGAPDLDGSSVAKQVFSECIQHPLTIFPWVGAVLAGVWTLVISASLLSIAAMFGLFAIGSIVFAYNYIIDGENRARVIAHQVLDARKAHIHVELGHLRNESEELGFAEGVKEANELASDYGNLMSYLDGKDGVDQFRLLAEDTFKEGVNVLKKAVSVYRAMTSIDVDVLKGEVASWRKERKGLDDTSARAKTLDRQIESHDKRISAFDDRQSTLDELIGQVDEIESALQTTYLELVELGDTKDPTKLLRDDGGASNRLKTAVTAARRVEERLSGKVSEADAAKREEFIRRGASRRDQS